MPKAPSQSILNPADCDDLLGGESLFAEGYEVEFLLLGDDFWELGLGLGMSGSEDGATVLIGKDRGLKAADAARVGHDLFLVKSDAGTENGDVYRGVGDVERLDRL